jgi:hypothetical protein
MRFDRNKSFMQQPSANSHTFKGVKLFKIIRKVHLRLIYLFEKYEPKNNTTIAINISILTVEIT